MEVAGEFGSPDRGDRESEFPMLLRENLLIPRILICDPPLGFLSLTLPELDGVGEHILHGLSDMAWNFNAVSARPGHERNLMPQISRRTAAMASLKVRAAFGYQAAVLGLIVCDLERSWA
jgi:hypothetical protein